MTRARQAADARHLRGPLRRSGRHSRRRLTVAPAARRAAGGL